jgi:hypothetical protein
LGRHLCFVIGPMCTINRITTEPACHLECAEYSLKVCPFLSNPNMRRVPTEHYAPDGKVHTAGMAEGRNPGAGVVWRTRKFSLVRTDTGPVIQVGDPEQVDWWCLGRRATPAEAHARFEEAAVFLRGRTIELDGPEALPMLATMTQKARRLLPMLPPGTHAAA